MHRIERSLLPALVLGLAFVLVACGSSSETGSSSDTPVEETTTTTIPTPDAVGKLCGGASVGLGPISDRILDQGAAVDLDTLNMQIPVVVSSLEECQTAIRAVSPTLPPGAQALADTYADSFDPMIALLMSPPAADGATAWLEQLSTATDATTAAGRALAAVEPSFGF